MNNYKGSVSSTSLGFFCTFRQNTIRSLISILFSIPVLVYSQDYNSYTMFDNFEIVAPSTPSIMMNNKSIKMYSSKIDKDTAIIITKLGTGLEFDIGEYNEIIKQNFDKSIPQGEDVAGNTVTGFTSTLDREKNTYVATYFVAPKKAGDGPYMAKKSIIKGKDDYTWYVTSYDKHDVQNIFNKYKDRIKHINKNVKRNDYTVKTLQEYKNACDLKDGSGCINLGLAYRKGKEVKKDDAKAVYFFQKSCELNIANGCYNLGLMFEKGTWVKKDFSIAVKFYQKSCDLNEGSGCNNLAILYSSGRGVSQNLGKAKELYSKACDLKFLDGCTNYATF